MRFPYDIQVKLNIFKSKVDKQYYERTLNIKKLLSSLIIWFNEIQNVLNNKNLSNEAKIQLLGELDYDSTEQTIENQIKELAQKQPELEMKARIAGLDESFLLLLPGEYLPPLW